MIAVLLSVIAIIVSSLLVLTGVTHDWFITTLAAMIIVASICSPGSSRGRGGWWDGDGWGGDGDGGGE
jgi:hypothetical protein